MSPRRPELHLVRGNPAAPRSRARPSLRLLPSTTDGPASSPPEALTEHQRTGTVPSRGRPTPPPLPPPECVEVTVSWGGNVLSVAHLSPGDGYWVGSKMRPGRPGYVFPAHVFGPGPFPLVMPTRQGVVAVLPDHVTASISTTPRQRLSRAKGATCGLLHRRADVRGDCFQLTTGRCCWIEACGMQIQIASVPRPHQMKPQPLRWPWMLLMGALLVHVALAAMMLRGSPVAQLSTPKMPVLKTSIVP